MTKLDGRAVTRLINGMNQRMEAAFLLLCICPQCGENCRVISSKKHAWEVWCPKHKTVSTRTKLELWTALDPSMGALTTDPAQ